MQESCVNRAVPPFTGKCDLDLWAWSLSVNEVEMKSSSWLSSQSLQRCCRWVQNIAFCSLQATQIVPALFLRFCNQIYHQESDLLRIFLSFSAFGLIMPGLKLSGALILWVLMLPFSRPNSQVLDCREVRSSFQFLYPGMKWTPETPVSGKQSYLDHHKLIQLCVILKYPNLLSKNAFKYIMSKSFTCRSVTLVAYFFFFFLNMACNMLFFWSFDY